MTGRLRSSYESDWLPYTQKAARSAVLSAVGEALSCRYEIPQELPREMLALSLRLKIMEER